MCPIPFPLKSAQTFQLLSCLVERTLLLAGSVCVGVSHSLELSQTVSNLKIFFHREAMKYLFAT